MKTKLVYLDTETMGLDMLQHEIWEVAFAVEDEPVQAGVVYHSPLLRYQQQALEVNGYQHRARRWDHGAADRLEQALYVALRDATVIGANPYFDLVRLSLRWERTIFADGDKGREPWHYRAIDIESYAMPLLGYGRPQSLHKVCADLRARGHEVPEPDHTSAGDVEALRAAYKALLEEAM